MVHREPVTASRAACLTAHGHIGHGDGPAMRAEHFAQVVAGLVRGPASGGNSQYSTVDILGRSAGRRARSESQCRRHDLGVDGTGREDGGTAARAHRFGTDDGEAPTDPHGGEDIRQPAESPTGIAVESPTGIAVESPTGIHAESPTGIAA